MNTYNHSIFDFQIKYPASWELQEEEDLISIFNSNYGFGALQFKLYDVGNDHIDIRNELDDYLKSRHNSYEIMLDTPFLVHGYNIGISEDKHWQYWMFKTGNLLVFTTYNCRLEDMGKEGDEIRSIIDNTFHIPS